MAFSDSSRYLCSASAHFTKVCSAVPCRGVPRDWCKLVRHHAMAQAAAVLVARATARYGTCARLRSAKAAAPAPLRATVRLHP